MTLSALSSHLSNAKDYPLSILFGVVVNNNDPLFLQRVQVRISLLHQGYTDEQLPWCLPITNLAPNGNSPSIGGCFVPAPSSPVAILTTMDDPTFCYYIGGTPQVEIDPAFKTNYPNVYGFRDSAGNLLKVDTVAKTWLINLVDGSYIEFNNGQMNVVTTSNLQINVQGNCALNASGSVDINGSTINMQASGNPAASLTPQPQTPPTIGSFSGQTGY